MVHLATDELLDRLRVARLDAVEVIGSGMEGTVVSLGAGTVAKVWHQRRVSEVERLAEFYAAVASAGLRFATPQILRVLRVDGLVVSEQPFLGGTPLWGRPGESPPLDAVLLDAVSEVVGGLGAVTVTPAMSLLPVLDGDPFPWDAPFGESLAALVESRVARAGSVLAGRVPGLDRLVGSVVEALRALPPARRGLVHGDLVPGNILVEDGRVCGVLDFGFLSTVGDPTFEAAVTASLIDMYGPDARLVEAQLDRLLGHPVDVVALYRLAYALITATCFSVSGSDGHFAWCVDQLRRPELRSVAGL